MAYYARLELVLKVDGLFPRLNQLYLSYWSHDYLEEKELMGIVAKKDLKYKKPPDLIQVGTTTRHNDGGESGVEDRSEEGDETGSQAATVELELSGGRLCSTETTRAFQIRFDN